MRLLLVDDEPKLAQTITNALRLHNYVVDVAVDGLEGWEFVQCSPYDIILLDVVLPKLDGVSLCRKLRQAGYQMPILLLTGRDSSHDKVQGLDAGADDYVVKPFDWEELLARIRALLRRDSTSLPAVLEWGSLCLNPAACAVTCGEQNLYLRPKEYKLLELFLRNPHRVFSCGTILEHLWSLEDSPSEETVRAHVKGLRQKLKTVGAGDAIETVYGLGYRLKSLEDRPSPDPKSKGNASISAGTLLRLQQELANTWEEIKPETLDQAHALQQGLAMAATWNQEQQQWAIAQAHQLAGLIGAFGFDTGTQIARQIETLLRSDLPFSPNQVTTLQRLTLSLCQELSGKKQVQEQRPTQDPEEVSSVSQVEFSSIAKLLIVDDDPKTCTVLKTILEPWGFQVTELLDPQQFWPTLENTTPDLLLLDVEMPSCNGLELCQQVRQRDRWAGLPVIFLTAHTDTQTVQQVFAVGADDFVSKPIVPPELITRLVSRIERSRFWQRLAEKDGLTQLANRSQFTKELQPILQKAQQERQVVCLALLRLQGLKSINHQYGYDLGDTLLRQVGEILRQSCRIGEMAARWSGSQFMVSFYGEKRTVRKRLATMLKALNQKGLGIPSSQLSLTWRQGLVEYPSEGQDLQMLYRQVETALDLSVP